MLNVETEIIETIAKWKADGEFNPEFNQVESEHSVMSAALGSALTGARTFTATSSQGLLYMHEILPNVSGMRLPVVMVNVSRAISAPITLWCDFNDVLAMRDSGWITFICESNQEVLDTIIMSYKIAEKILLPVIVNMDGFITSFTRTEVDIPKQGLVDKFLPKLNLPFAIDIKKPRSYGLPAMDDYMFFKSQHHKAMLDSLKIIEKTQKEYQKLTKRRYDFIESYKLENAKVAIVMMGANSTIGKAAIENLRKKGVKAGLLRIRLLRPFPEKQIINSLKNIKKVIVLDQNISPGLSGILYPEVRSILKNKIVSNYIIGLGGKPVAQKEIENIILEILKSDKEERKWLMK